MNARMRQVWAQVALERARSEVQLAQMHLGEIEEPTQRDRDLQTIADQAESALADL